MERVTILQIKSTSRLISGRRWQLCGDAHRVQRLLQSIDLVQVLSLGRLLRRSVAFIGSIYGL